MTTIVKVKRGRILTIRHVERDGQPRPRSLDVIREGFEERQRPPLSPYKSKKHFAPKPNREGRRAGELKRLDERGKMTEEQRVARLVEFARREGVDRLRAELEIHERKVEEIQMALALFANEQASNGESK